MNLRDILNLIHANDLPTFAHFKKFGGNIDRWKEQDWIAMARAFSATEDLLEYNWREMRQSSKKEEARSLLLRLQAVRRSLEDSSDL